MASVSTDRVRAVLTALGLTATIREFPQGTHTAQDAATAIGTTLAQIVKTLVFTAGVDPLVVLTSGANRVDTARLSALVGQPVRRADADTVRAATGFAIGGVAPMGYPAPLRTFVDEDLLTFAEVWAAAGTPTSVFPIAPADLLRATGGTIAAVAERPDAAGA